MNPITQTPSVLNVANVAANTATVHTADTDVMNPASPTTATAFIPFTSKPAKRLVDTKLLNRDEWLEVRKQGIGSSDAAAACGLNPYMSMLELWMIKTGRMQPQVEQAVSLNTAKPYAPLYWGTKLEPLIAEHYQNLTSNKVRRVNAVLQHPDDDKSFMLANLDYSIVGSDEVQILECKSVGQWGAKHWQHSVPLHVIIQVQHQLAVTGKQAAHVCVLLCGHEAKLFKVERNELVIDSIIRAERSFWAHVLHDTPPMVDGSESTARALAALYPEHNPKDHLLFTELADIDVLFDQMLQADALVKQHQEEFDLLKHRIQSLMRDGEKAVFSQGYVTWKTSKDSTVLDQKALLKAHPHLLEEFPQIRRGSRRFNIYPNKH